MRVHLRERKQTKNGKVSLYLEIYKGSTTDSTGKVKVLREYKYLGLYLYDKPKNSLEREHNKQMRELAENIRNKTELDIKTGQYGFSADFKKDVNFIEFIKQQAGKRKGKRAITYMLMMKHLIRFAGHEITFREIDTAFCEGFLNYLTNIATKPDGSPLNKNTAILYFQAFNTCLREAVKEGIIMVNPTVRIRLPKKTRHQRVWLTIDELRMLAKTECPNNLLKRAFLFSCLTGLRWSDIKQLKWSNITKTDTGWKIVLNQQKTKEILYLDISETAMNYLGAPGHPEEEIFKGLNYGTHINIALTKWASKAGISKKLSFHCGRHTFAVLQLMLGTDIYTLSKILGHTEIKTTLIYADIADEKKREAMNKLSQLNI